jgi:glucokinase
MSITRVLAVDIGGSKLMMGCVDTAGQVSDSITIPLDGGISQHKVMDSVLQASKQLDLSGVRAVGVNIPGLADVKNGLWVHAPYSGISDFPVANEFAKIFGLPVAIENDVNACALAEKRFGLCKNIDDYIWVTISNGIGGSVVLNGGLYGGSAGNAGEIGHFIVEENENKSFLCGCGNTGCLEAQAAGPGIARLYGLLSGKKIPPDMRSKQVGELCKRGDSYAAAAFEKAGYYIGKALTYAVNFVNPGAVVLGGGVMMDDDLIMPSLELNFRRFLFEKANKDVKIMKTALGYDAALLGAATLALEKLEKL